ncbi:hypothetical protein [Labilibaculum euxinus]
MELKDQVDVVLNNYPELLYDSLTNTIVGELYITRKDSYDVKIELDRYPTQFPIVYEIGERIPKTLKRHTYSDTGSCCLTTQAKAQVLLKTKITSLYHFIKEIVIPYFQNNSYFELNGKYRTAEYAHNSFGIVEGYRDILEINNDRLILRLILDRIKKTKLRIHDLCYCGSGISLKKCNSGKHCICYKNFRMIDKIILINDLNHFAKHLDIK